jgi:hypothetical protein
MIKVNAECDKEVAPLVAALNEVRNLITLDSCQAGVYGEAYVFFSYGVSWQDTGFLVNELAECLRECGVCCECIIRLEWVGSNDRPRAKLVCDTGHVGSIADIISSSAARINVRMSEKANAGESVADHQKRCGGMIYSMVREHTGKEMKSSQGR